MAKKRKTNSSKKSLTSNPIVRNTNTKLKTAKGRKTSSSRWLQRQLNDPYVQASKRDGYRSRAAYKLLQMNEKFDFIKPHSRVLDLGAAPGGWSQVVASITGANTSDIDSQIIALDILPIEPIPGVKILSYDSILSISVFNEFDNSATTSPIRPISERPSVLRVAPCNSAWDLLLSRIG